MATDSNTMTVDKDLLVDMVKYVLNRPYAEVHTLVEKMKERGLLTNNSSNSSVANETKTQEAAPQ